MIYTVSVSIDTPDVDSPEAAVRFFKAELASDSVGTLTVVDETGQHFEVDSGASEDHHGDVGKALNRRLGQIGDAFQEQARLARMRDENAQEHP